MSRRDEHFSGTVKRHMEYPDFVPERPRRQFLNASLVKRALAHLPHLELPFRRPSRHFDEVEDDLRLVGPFVFFAESLEPFAAKLFARGWAVGIDFATFPDLAVLAPSSLRLI